MTHRWLILAAALVGIAPIAARADSIWDRRDPRAAHLFQDNRARRIGDVLTVAINEATNANEREQRALDKGNTMKSGLTFSGKTSAGGSASGELGLGNDSRRTFSGSAQLSSDRTFADRITVTVIDVLPNGNLVIEGSRSRIVAGERRELRITGIVRPADIGQQNTVQSRFVANFRVIYSGQGPQSNFTKQGWLSRAFNFLWPF